MITRDNQTLYSTLFAKANTLLELPNEEYGDEITNIDQYFCHLKHIADKVVGTDGTVSDPSYFILPVDEPTFKINANTRQIEVPAEFKHGVSVKGDEIAETIYFVIDRYFDTTDFYDKNLKAIIQWENASGQKISHTTEKAIIEDISNIDKNTGVAPVMVIFGWPLSSEVTEHAGNVTFSVRFYNTIIDENGVERLEYSFSTMNQTIKINPSLDLDIIDGGFETVDKNWLIYKRLRNSIPAQIDLQAIQPIIDFFSPAAGTEADLDETGKVLVKMKANYPSGTNNTRIGIQKYELIREDKYGIHSVVLAATNENVFGTAYELTSDKAMNTTEQYYYFNGTDYVAYTDRDWPNNIDLYEKVYTYEVDTAGNYYFIITNFLGDSNYSSNTSGKFTIKLPEEPLVYANNPFDYYGIMEEILDEDNVGTGTYRPCSISLVAEDKDGGNTPLRFNWYRANLLTDIELETIATDLSSPTLEATKEGYYYLDAINTRNNLDVATRSEPIRVTKPADAPVLSYIAYKYNITAEELEQQGLGPNIKLTVVPHSERTDGVYQFTWYKVNEEGKNPVLIGTGDNYTFSDTQVDSYYMCTVTNVYNTISKASSNSVIFKIVKA